MTILLRQAITELEKLPPEHQDILARRILAEMADEAAWMEQFRDTSDTQWDKLAEGAKREIAAGDSVPLADVFPPIGL
jgi:hypothetical protein